MECRDAPTSHGVTPISTLMVTISFTMWHFLFGTDSLPRYLWRRWVGTNIGIKLLPYLLNVNWIHWQTGYKDIVITVHAKGSNISLRESKFSQNSWKSSRMGSGCQGWGMAPAISGGVADFSGERSASWSKAHSQLRLWNCETHVGQFTKTWEHVTVASCCHFISMCEAYYSGWEWLVQVYCRVAHWTGILEHVSLQPSVCRLFDEPLSSCDGWNSHSNRLYMFWFWGWSSTP